ncbi:MAG: hypothetical protein IJ532_02745 [Alphaproteobacteria bacterium]|nr:hypothetical protein [Alphaproteobacteria bacterium]
MKKYFILLISILLLAPCVGAQTFKRTTKKPGFFVPKGALQTGARKEKLPPIEKMIYRGQPAPIVIEMQRQAQEKARQEQAEKQKQEAIARLKQEKEQTEKQKQEEFAKLKQEQEDVKSQKLLTAEENTDNIENQNPENNPVQITDIALVDISPEDEAKFTQILVEYHNDVEAISQQKTVRNQRLIDMIADFTDTDRSI